MLPISGLMSYYYTSYLEGTFSFVVPLGLTALWFGITLLTGKVKGLLTNEISLWWMAYLLLCIFMVIIGFSNTNLNHIISNMPIYLIPVMGYFVLRYYNKKEKTLLLVTFFIIFFINLFYNIFLGYQFPEIFEEQVSTDESIEFRKMMNMCDTEFIIVGYLLIGLFMLFAIEHMKKGIKVLCVLLATTIAYHMLFQNTRGTAILMLAAEIGGFILASKEPKLKKSRVTYYMFSVVFGVVLLFVVFVPLMNWVLENIQSERLAERLNDLLDFGKSGGDMNQVSEGSFSQRVLFAQTSLNTFFSNPINMLIGIGDQATKLGTDLVKTGIGNHSEFIDVLARYGLVGAFVFWKIMSGLYRLMRGLIVSRDILKYVNVIFVIVIFSGFFNTIFHPALLFFLFISFPIAIELLSINVSYQYGK